MKPIYTIKKYFRSNFRELFLYHNSSLEFRAKLFALVVGAKGKDTSKEFELLHQQALKIYKDDELRALTFEDATKEYLHKIYAFNKSGVDKLARDISKTLKHKPRFAQKIDTELLIPFISCHNDTDTQSYQEHIIQFLDTLRLEYL